MGGHRDRRGPFGGGGGGASGQKGKPGHVKGLPRLYLFTVISGFHCVYIYIFCY